MGSLDLSRIEGKCGQSHSPGLFQVDNTSGIRLSGALKKSW